MARFIASEFRDEGAWRNLMGEMAFSRFRKAHARISGKGLLEPGWNWAAFILPEFWLVYHRYWKLFFCIVGGCALTLEFVVPFVDASHFIAAYLIGSRILLPMYADAFTYWWVGQRISRIKERGGDPTSDKFRGEMAPIAIF